MRFVLKALIFLSTAFGLGGCSSLLYFPSDASFTDPLKLAHKPESVFFRTEDGVRLHGWYFRSPVRPAKATFLFFHGNAQNLSAHFHSLYWALDKGFDFFIFDYRGYGISDGAPSPEGTVKDGRAALAWINEHKDPKSKLVIFGQSLGGIVALRVACEDHSRFDKIIVDSTFHSYRSIGRKVLTRSWITWPLQWVGWLVMNDSYAPNDCTQEISPKPVLIVHGTNDRIIEYEFGEKVFSLAKEPKEFWRVEGGGHTDFLFRNGFEYQESLVEWVEQQ